MAAGADKVVPWFSGWACLWPAGQRAASIEPRRPTMIGSDFGSAEGHFPFASTVPGNHRAGPCDPGGAPYGRTEYGRPRCARGRIPGPGKGLRNPDRLEPRQGLRNDPDLRDQAFMPLQARENFGFSGA